VGRVKKLTDQEQQRFNKKWKKRGDCHVWIGPLDKDGYGSLYLWRNNHPAHRVAWYIAHGKIEEGKMVTHSCNNRACVKVAHLRLVKAKEIAANSRKTECQNGHPFDIIRTIKTTGRTQRVCSVCERAKKKRLRAKWRAEGSPRI
jgi:hypothetical protein